MRRTGTRGTHLLAILGLLCALVPLSCSQTQAVDWAAYERAGRIVDQPAGLDVLMGKAQYHWSDGSVPLELIAVDSVLTPGVRLGTWVSGACGNPTRFLLDTGSVGTLLGQSAPLARELYLSRIPFQTFGTEMRGYMGHLPEVRMGPLMGRDLVVNVITESPLPASEQNILGIVHLYHTQLEHRGGRWTLRSGSARLAVTEPGWATARLEPGTPIVQVHDPGDKPVYALIDTGAFHSFAVGSCSRGTYELHGLDGTVLHRIAIDQKKNRQVGPLAGYTIGVVIGMDVLRSREWRMTFDQSTWSFAPSR